MPLDQNYEKVDGDESSDPLFGGEKSSRITRAPPSHPPKRSALTMIAILALVATVFLAAVAAVSSAVVAYRLPSAVQAKISADGLTKPAPAAAATTSAAAAPVKEVSDSLKDTSSDSTATDALASFGKSMPLKHCGSNQDEARALGCVFDVMMQLWTPPECMDTPLSERFLANGNWTWWANGDASKVYNDTEIRLGNHDVVYVAQSYHRHHCIFAWERLVRAMRNQAPLIEELISYDHVMHCRHNTLRLPSEGAEEVRGVVAPTGYTSCASYDVWLNNNLPENKMSSVEKIKREIELWTAEME